MDIPISSDLLDRATRLTKDRRLANSAASRPKGTMLELRGNDRVPLDKIGACINDHMPATGVYHVSQSSL